MIGDMLRGSFNAFNTDDHDILGHYSVIGVTKSWFISYLKGRKQFIQMENETSTTKEILNGIPQGLVLGPLLFLIYITDLNTCTQLSKTYHSADDTSIMQSNKS